MSKAIEMAKKLTNLTIFNLIPGTVLFLGISVLAALVIILLVQLIAGQEVCMADVPRKELPFGVQKILTKENHLDSWRCPYGNNCSFLYSTAF